MKSSAKAKVSAVRASLRKVAAALTLRPAFPAWIDAESGVAFPAAVVTPRVRDCLVLRLVERKPTTVRSASYAHGAR
ncbi:MAG TPA: hypothetical protein PLB90_15895 [Opitutaceae bacterium]|nr:hypothetical protein [Opitutaceae bacterium]